MTDHPILFSAPMIRANLREIEHPGTGKTQTRRVLKPQLGEFDLVGYFGEGEPYVTCVSGGHQSPIAGIKYAPGDRLWVREEHWAWGHWETTNELTKTGKPKRKFVRDQNRDVTFEKPLSVQLNKFDNNTGWHTRLGRFMFRADSRMTLVLTDVRVQRLQDVSEEDARAEGIEPYSGIDPDCSGFLNYKNNSADRYWLSEVDSFRTLWDSINGAGAWDANPWVAAYTYTPHLTNIDQGGEL